MKFNNPYWTPKTKIETLSRWILVHSYLYYELDYNVVPDHMFDNNCNQLQELIEAHREEFIDSTYYYALKEFDGSTGYGFYQNLDTNHQFLIERDAHYLKERGYKWNKPMPQK